MFKLSVCVVSNEIAADLAILSHLMFEKCEYWVGRDDLAPSNTVGKYTGEYSIGGCRL
jgi:hypothetical protein